MREAHEVTDAIRKKDVGFESLGARADACDIVCTTSPFASRPQVQRCRPKDLLTAAPPWKHWPKMGQKLLLPARDIWVVTRLRSPLRHRYRASAVGVATLTAAPLHSHAPLAEVISLPRLISLVLRLLQILNRPLKHVVS